LNAIGARLYLMSSRGGTRQELRLSRGELVVDDPSGFGAKLIPAGKSLKLGSEVFDRAAATKPNPIPEKWRGLIGEYGEDHNILYILEKDGKLQALIEWVFLYPLEEAGEDVYKFPNFGLYHGDKIVFRRDGTGRGIEANAASVLFARRNLKGENSTYKLDGVGSVEKLRGDALKATPPLEKNAVAKAPDLVDLTTLDPSIKLDIRYASDDNFLGAPLYTSARAFLQRPAAEALVRAHQKLKDAGYGLLIHDAYRPWHVTKIFRDATPAQFHHFVADPNQGSRHNRGCAVDLTLYDRGTGKAIPMVSGYDEFSDRAFPHYLGGTSLQRYHRDLLRRTMEAERFAVYEFEWWHFDYHAWRQYPILNDAFEKLAK
jgi:D-alanyl-D-alanine dipeptidase